MPSLSDEASSIMSLISAIQEGETLYIAILQARAEIEKAERRLAELKARSAAGEADWSGFLARHPTLGPVVTQRVEALERAGLLEAVISDDSGAACVSAAEAGSSPSPSAQAPIAEAKPLLRGRTAQTPEPGNSRSPPGSPLAERSAPVTVGPLDVRVPAKPPGSSSTKSQVGYKITWAANYKRGFDDVIEGKRRKLRPVEGPAREGYNRGRADAEAWKRDSNSKAADAVRKGDVTAPVDDAVKAGASFEHDNPRRQRPGESAVLAGTDQETTGLNVTCPTARPIQLAENHATQDHIFSPENLDPFEVEITEFEDSDPSSDR